MKSYDCVTRVAQLPGQFGNVGGANLAAATDDGGTLIDPTHCEFRVVRRVKVLALLQGIYSRRVLQELFRDAGEPVA